MRRVGREWEGEQTEESKQGDAEGEKTCRVRRERRRGTRRRGRVGATSSGYRRQEDEVGDQICGRVERSLSGRERGGVSKVRERERVRKTK